MRESCSVEALRCILGERDVSILKLQHDTGSMLAELEEEKRQTEGKLPPPEPLVFSRVPRVLA